MRSTRGPFSGKRPSKRNNSLVRDAAEVNYVYISQDFLTAAASLGYIWISWSNQPALK